MDSIDSIEESNNSPLQPRDKKHSRSAIFSKLQERRLHPELMPGQPKQLLQNPGPNQYYPQNQGIDALK